MPVKPALNKAAFTLFFRLDPTDEAPSLRHSTSAHLTSRPKISRCHGSAQQLSRAGSAKNSKLNKSQENVDWSDLGEKIEDWFGYAKTPGNSQSHLSSLASAFSIIVSFRPARCLPFPGHLERRGRK